MTAIKAADVDRFIARPDPAQPIMLVFGPDAGLVRERVDALVRASVDDPAIPSRWPASKARSWPPIRRGWSRRPIRCRCSAAAAPSGEAGARNIAAGGRDGAGAPPASDCRIVIEAGDLTQNAPLRALCEKAKVAAALPCYADNERDLARLIDEEMREAELGDRAGRARRAAALLGGDRLASRSEIRKLALYARGQESVELDDVMAVVADASELALDGVVDAAFAGRTGEVETEFAKARAGGSSPAAIVSAAIRQVANLHKMKLAIEGGESIEFAMKRGAPPVHFSRERGRRSAARMDTGAACCVPWSNWPRLRSKCAATRRSPRPSRSVPSCRWR